MLQSIIIKKTATYDDTGISIENLKKINFIYGANGSGKTTISKILSNNNQAKYKDCLLNWVNDTPINILVYNKDFKELNFNKSNIDGVFTIGQATKEEIEKIELKKVELKNLKDIYKSKFEEVASRKNTLNQEQNSFKEIVWTEVYKNNEKNFKDAFTGFMNSKDTFRGKVLREFNLNTSELTNIDELKLKAETIFQNNLTKFKNISELDYIDLLATNNNEIWKKVIIGKSDIEIANLIQKLNINDWVNMGRSYINDSNICPFCQKETITNEFKNKLEEYFDESFTNDTNKINENYSKYLKLSETLINQTNQIINNIKTEPSKLDIDNFLIHQKALESQINANIELIKNKIKEPSRIINLASIEEEITQLNELINQANKSIYRHNNLINNYEAEKNKLINAIWKFLVEQHKTLISNYINKVNGISKGIDTRNEQLKELQKQINNLNDEINIANQNITSVQPSVDAINKTLKTYGFNNFEIVSSEADKNQYQIKRDDGTLADTTLSEGEITFITFLYFLQLCKGGYSQDSLNEDRVIIIDDPISSLDSNILFVVSSLIKGMIKSIKNETGNIKQLFILTHNVFFHKEASFINGRTKECNNTFFWILRKNNKISTIQAFEKKNPIQTSYELLWQELKNKEYNSEITLQNVMRRIIENYFGIIGKSKDDYIINSFESPEEQEICKSLIHWINDGSHSINDDLFIQSQDNVVDNYLKVFRDIFINTNHEGHYNMMMGIS